MTIQETIYQYLANLILTDSILLDYLNPTSADSKLYPAIAPLLVVVPFIVYDFDDTDILNDQYKKNINLILNIVIDNNDYKTASVIAERLDYYLDKNRDDSPNIPSDNFNIFYSKQNGGAPILDGKVNQYIKTRTYDIYYTMK